MFAQSMQRPTTITTSRISAAPISVECDVKRLSLESLMRHCASESERFYRGQAHDTSYAYELFRRALVERNEEAWNMLYSHYTALVEGWVRRSAAFTSSGESSEFFVVGAFAKFWRAVTPERFATFPTLATLLHYLRMCATSVVIDSVRAQSWSEMLPEDAADQSVASLETSGDDGLERVEREEFWHFINAQLNSEEERIVVYGSFVLGMTPRAIFQQYATVFESIGVVYNIKRNVLGRLSRNPQLQQMLVG